MSRVWSPLRVATALTLGAWAAVFWFLLATGRTTLYLSSRTAWVVPMGAVVLTVAAVARMATARTDHREVLSGGRAWSLGIVVLPALLVMAVPPGALGSFAVSRRSAVSAGVVPADDVSSGQITLVDVAAAKWSDDASRQLVRRAGAPVSFVGFVSEDTGGAADEFVLTRFLVSCCVADALSVQVRVVGAPPGLFEPDQWVKVAGNIYPLGHEMIVDASSVTPVSRPSSPYLNI
jgi:putative membrane protein